MFKEGLEELFPDLDELKTFPEPEEEEEAEEAKEGEEEEEEEKGPIESAFD